MSDEKESPIRDAVVAFCVLVRAVADGNRTRQREQLNTLRDCGFDVRVRRNAAVKLEGTATR